MNRISEIYNGEYLAETKSITQQRINWICSQSEGLNIIDIGCSQGIVPLLLAREGFKVLGIDIDEDAIEYASRSLAKEPPETRANLTFTRGSMYELELDNDHYDTVIMGEVLEHLAKPERAVRIAYLILRNNGKYIITVPFGFGLGKQHRQTFYLTSIYKLLQPHFDITDVEIIGAWLCLACRKTGVSHTEVTAMDIKLAEWQEKEFAVRENLLLARETRAIADAQAKLDKSKEQLQQVYQSISFRLGQLIVTAITKPGSNTFMLPYQILKLWRHRHEK